MKAFNYTLGLICLLMINLSFGQSASNEGTIEPSPNKLCNTFESGTNEGWQELNSSINIDTPAMDGTKYLRARDASGPSYIYNNSFPTNWERYKGQCLCFDYKVFNDGKYGSTVNINPKIILMNNPNPLAATIRATFVATVTVTEDGPWAHVCAPIMPSDGVTLPGNDHGQWTNVTPAEWNSLLTNIQTVGFFVDVAGSNAIMEIIGVDNICIQKCTDIVDPEPNDEGAYCCEGENLVKNGNFEAGDSGFTSDYSNNSAVYPGEYDVTNSAAAFGAGIKDHSFCADPTQYATNSKFMLANGKTQQSASSLIWTQDISGLRKGRKYKFCANFKNMPQCTFDIVPNINMEVAGAGSTGFSAISADPNDPCDWINKELNFTATGSSMTLRIILDETGNGDGNDVAIDDISVTELIDTELNITVQHQGNPQKITASINSIDTSDDQLPGGKCEYFWFVAKVDSYPPISIDFGTFASGNNGGNSNGSSPWNLTTAFPDYVFNQNTMYILGMYMPACECYDAGFTYQLTFNNGLMNSNMSAEQKQQIINAILKGPKGGISDNPSNESRHDSGLNVYPNPAKGKVNLYMKGDTLKNVEIFSISGQAVFTKIYAGKEVNDELDVSSFASGIYFIKAKGANGKQYNSKLLKE